MITRPLVLALLAACTAFPALGAEPCPESCVGYRSLLACTPQAVRNVDISESCYPYPGQRQWRAVYDLALGTAFASARSCLSPGPSAHASAVPRDRYRVVGPAGGVLVFAARVHAEGSTSGFGSVRVTVYEVGGDFASVDEGSVGGFNQDLVLPLSHAPGEEFELGVDVSVSAESFAQASGLLSFTGLPPGYGITSCQGFTGEGAVPSLPRSWGALKLRYR